MQINISLFFINIHSFKNYRNRSFNNEILTREMKFRFNHLIEFFFFVFNPMYLLSHFLTAGFYLFINIIYICSKHSIYIIKFLTTQFLSRIFILHNNPRFIPTITPFIFYFLFINLIILLTDIHINIVISILFFLFMVCIVRNL